jgi:pyruvate dehydrogenase complex dehydrogenase (E1) component
MRQGRWQAPASQEAAADPQTVLDIVESGQRKGLALCARRNFLSTPVTLLAPGSEPHLAVEARQILQREGVPTAVVSMPCRLLFQEQDAAYKKAVLGETHARVAVEAAVELGWERYLGFEGKFVGMHDFGESGKIDDVYAGFDITTDPVVRAARKVLKAMKNSICALGQEVPGAQQPDCPEIFPSARCALGRLTSVTVLVAPRTVEEKRSWTQ